MNILLVSPGPFPRNGADRLRLLLHRAGIHGGDSPPLGLVTLAAPLEAAGHAVRVLDMRVESPTRGELEDLLGAFAPDLVGFYLATFNIREGVEAARFVKSARPGAVTVAGGPNVDIYPGETMRHACFDWAMRGECDLTFPAFVASLAAGRADRSIEGLAHRRAGGITVNPGYPMPPDLDALPLPAHHLLRGRYRYFAACREPYTSMIASRGCPYACRFCGRVPGSRKVRYRSAGRLVEEMRLLRSLGYREINFFDDLFTVNRRRVLDFCRALAGARLDLVWSVRARVDCVDGELLTAMKGAGCRRLYFGVESGSDRSLGLMNKRITTAQAREALRACRRLGLETVSYFIVGFPGETEADLALTLAFSRGLETDFCSFNMFEPLPATPALEAWLAETGAPDPWLPFLRLETDEIPRYHGGLARETVERYYRRCWNAFYFRPRTWFNLARQVRSPTRVKNFARAGLSLLLGPATGNLAQKS